MEITDAGKRFRFLMDAGRMRDAVVEVEGLHPAMLARPGDLQGTVKRLVMTDGDGKRINREDWFSGWELRAIGLSGSVAARPASEPDAWRKLPATGPARLAEDVGRRIVAIGLISRETGVPARLGVAELAAAARRQAAELGRVCPRSAVSWARRQPTVLYDPAWIDGPAERERVFRELASAIESLADRASDETFYVRDGPDILMAGNLSVYLAEHSDPEISIVDDSGRLVLEAPGCGGPASLEVRIGDHVDAPMYKNDPAAAEAWARAREPRAADFLGIPQPNIGALQREAMLREVAGRTAGVKEIRAGDRVVSAFCADQRDLVSSDGQDSVEYNACDDDVLEAERREFMRRGADADMDGIADGGEIDADHDGVPDMWARGETGVPDEEDLCIER